MKEMVRNISKNACPKCGGCEFIIAEFESNSYRTNRNGEITESTENFHTIVGKCLRCGSDYEMHPFIDGFMPLTPLRKFRLQHKKDRLEDTNTIDYTYIENPMREKDDS